MNTTIEEMDFLIDALATGRAATAAARAKCVTGLQITRSITMMTPRGEPRELKAGEVRYVFTSKAAMMEEIFVTNPAKWGDTDFTLWMQDAKTYVVDAEEQ